MLWGGGAEDPLLVKIAQKAKSLPQTPIPSRSPRQSFPTNPSYYKNRTRNLSPDATRYKAENMKSRLRPIKAGTTLPWKKSVVKNKPLT